MDYVDKAINSSEYDKLNQELEEAKKSLEELIDIKKAIIKMAIEYHLLPYKTDDKKNPKYYLMKPDIYEDIPVNIPKWLYDDIRYELKKLGKRK